MTTIDEELINRGYQRYRPTDFDNDWVVDRFQKRFDDNNGKKYFIDFIKYDNSYLIEHEKRRGVKDIEEYLPHYSYEVNTQLSKDDKPFNVELLSHWTNIDEVEQFIDDLWNKLELDYYERWY